MSRERDADREVRCTEKVLSTDLDRFEPVVQMQIPGVVEEVAPAVERIMARIRHFKCAGKSEFEVEVALLEALGNAVEHGCGNDPGKMVEVRVGCCEECGLLVVIRDPGPGFDPSRLPNPVDGENLLRTHGRGVWLINQLMDSVHYANGGTELRMHKGRSEE